MTTTDRTANQNPRQDADDAATALLHRLIGRGFIALVPHDTSASPLGREPEFMTTQELARLMKVDPSSVRRWRTAVPTQGPPFIRLSRRVVKYRRDDVERWLADRRVDPDVA